MVRGQDTFTIDGPKIVRKYRRYPVNILHQQGYKNISYLPRYSIDIGISMLYLAFLNSRASFSWVTFVQNVTFLHFAVFMWIDGLQ